MEKIIWNGSAEMANTIFGESYGLYWQYVTSDSQAIKVGKKIYNVGDEISTDWKTELFEDLARPLIMFLNEWYHPHAIAIVNSTGAQVLEGSLITKEITDYILE